MCGYSKFASAGYPRPHSACTEGLHPRIMRNRKCHFSTSADYPHLQQAFYFFLNFHYSSSDKLALTSNLTVRRPGCICVMQTSEGKTNFESLGTEDLSEVHG